MSSDISDECWRPGRRIVIIGAGPGGVSAALAFHRRGFDVRLYERTSEPRPLGGGVLLSVPVLVILRYYGVDVTEFGSHTLTEFRNNKGRLRAALPFNEDVEEAFGIRGWHYGMLRELAFGRMMELMPEGTVIGDHEFVSYTEEDDQIVAHFRDREDVTADILVGADGIGSQVSRQALGDPELFHIGIRCWLSWCRSVPGLKENLAVLSHSSKYQASYFPMLHEGKPAYLWWVIEPMEENAPLPDDPRPYLDDILKNFADPMPLFSDATDYATQSFSWNIYNRKSLKHWGKGRVVCVGDAVHPTSPYAAYGMGMAIEDGYFLARAFQSADLSRLQSISDCRSTYESDRVEYVNHQVDFARALGQRFHRSPKPLAWLRDLVFDNTGILQKLITKDYLGAAEAMSLSLKELHVEK